MVKGQNGGPARPFIPPGGSSLFLSERYVLNARLPIPWPGVVSPGSAARLNSLPQGSASFRWVWSYTDAGGFQVPWLLPCR